MIKGWSDGRSLFIPRHRVAAASIPTCLQPQTRHVRCTSANPSRCLDRIELEHVLDDGGDPEVEVAERDDRVYARVCRRPVRCSPETAPSESRPIHVRARPDTW